MTGPESLTFTERVPAELAQFSALPNAEPPLEPTQVNRPDRPFVTGNRLLAVAATATALFGVNAASSNTAPTEAHTGAKTSSEPIFPSTKMSVQTYFKTERGHASVKAGDLSSGKVTILGNVMAKGLPQKVIRRAEARGDCRTIDGKKEVIYTWGLTGADHRGMYGRDYRKSRFCNIGGKLVRIVCGNKAFVVEKPEQKPKNVAPGRVVWVKDITKLKLHVVAKADVTASCVEGGASASAHGYGRAVSDVRFKVAFKTRGNTISSVSGDAYGKARADAKAKVNCEDTTEVIVSPPTQPPPPPPHMNQQPTGTSNPSIHRYTNSNNKECFEDIYDSDGDRVDLQDVRFEDENGNPVGGITRAPYDLNQGDMTVQCVDFDAGPTPVNKVWMLGTLNDHHGNMPRFRSSYSFQILARPQSPKVNPGAN